MMRISLSVVIFASSAEASSLKWLSIIKRRVGAAACSLRRHPSRVGVFGAVDWEAVRARETSDSAGSGDTVDNWQNAYTFYSNVLAEYSTAPHWAPSMVSADLYERTDQGEFFIGHPNNLPISKAHPPLAGTQAAVIVKAALSPERKYEHVIKYVHNCPQLMMATCDTRDVQDTDSVALARDEDDDSFLVREFAVQKTISNIAAPSICPRAVTLSDMVSGGDFTNPKVFLSGVFMADPSIAWKPASCANMGAQFRALVQERVGITVAQYFRSKYGNKYPSERLREALEIGLAAIDLVEQLHTVGFIHDDIHDGNLAFRRPLDLNTNPITTTLLPQDLVLIDFGSARFFPAEFSRDQDARGDVLAELETRTASLLSPWQLQKKRSGRRDDLFRVLETVVNLITNNAASIAAKRLENDSKDVSMNVVLERIHDYKTGLYGRVIDEATRADYMWVTDDKEITALLKSSLGLVLSIALVDDKPSYRRIKEPIETALSLLPQAKSGRGTMIVS